MAISAVANFFFVGRSYIVGTYTIITSATSLDDDFRLFVPAMTFMGSLKNLPLVSSTTQWAAVRIKRSAKMLPPQKYEPSAYKET